MNKPLFTIAIPVFNRLNYSKEAIQSVLSQSYKDFELVIIDDYSTDGTWEYIKLIKDPRVRIFRNNSNIGIVSNWRRCIEEAKGKWFKFLMADDLMFPDALYILKRLIDKYPQNHVIVTSGIGFEDFDKVEKYLGIDNRELKNTDQYLKNIKEIIEERKRFNQTWAMPNAYTLLAKDCKELIASNSYKEVEDNLGDTGHCVDYFILYAIAIKYKTMIEMDVPLYGVRYHTSNLSKSYNKDILYHLNGDKYIHYMLYDYKGIENLYIVRHAFRVYLHYIKNNKRELITFGFFKKAMQLFIFLFQHILGINKCFKTIKVNQ